MAIIIDEKRARESECKCYKLDDSLVCWSRGAIGTLTDSQEKTPEEGGYCPTKDIRPPTKALKERYEKFTTAIERASRRYHKEDHDIKKWLETVSEEMGEVGLEI